MKQTVPLHNLFITENNYRQLISLYTTHNKTAIDHFKNWQESQAQLHIIKNIFFRPQINMCIN